MATWRKLNPALRAHSRVFTELDAFESNFRLDCQSAIDDFRRNWRHVYGTVPPTPPEGLAYGLVMMFPRASRQKLMLLVHIILMNNSLRGHSRGTRIRFCIQTREVIGKLRLAVHGHGPMATGINLRVAELDLPTEILAAIGRCREQRLCGPLLIWLASGNHRLTEEMLDGLERMWTAEETRAARSFTDFDNFLGYRLNDFGAGFWSWAVRFSLDLNLPQGTLDELSRFTDLAFTSAALTFDHFTYGRLARPKANALDELIYFNRRPVVTFAEDLKDLIQSEDQTLKRDVHVSLQNNIANIVACHQPTLDARKYLLGLKDFVAGYHYYFASTFPGDTHRILG